MRRAIHLSASAIKEFLHCANCFRLKYVEGIRPIQDNDDQRPGTNWHAMHEIYRDTIAINNDPAEAFTAVVNHINTVYGTVPDDKTHEEWEMERTVLIVSFMGYLWYYQNDVIETLTTELPFKVPLFNPRTGEWEPMEDVLRIGKIDRIVRINGRVSISDYKSTSKPIDPQSEYWEHLGLDPQMSMYVGVAREMQQAGELEQFGVGVDDPFGGAYYDVWHKPKIEPTMLTQGDSKALAETGRYFEQEYVVQVQYEEKTGVVVGVLIDGEQAAFKAGAKAGTFAVKETIQMFGARLYNDIKARPEFYFQRREIPRTDTVLAKFAQELHNIYLNIRYMIENGTWYRNDQQDSMLRHGDMGVLCYRNDLDLSDGHTPVGFKRIFKQEIADADAPEATA